ncbi:MAG: hypothetical protein ACAI25_18315 [Planctomycetota bacterium]
MHILLGGLFGLLCGVIGTVIVSVATGRPVTLRSLAAGAIGGLVGGLITAATLGAGGFVAATSARAATSFVAGGAGGASAAKVYDNAVEDRPILEGVPEAAGIGAVAGLASYGGSVVLEPIVRRALPTFASFWFGRVPSATPPPATPGLLRALDDVTDDVSAAARAR